MVRIYLAASWRNAKQPELVGVTQDAGHRVYDYRNPPSGVDGFKWADVDPERKAWRAEDYRRVRTTHPVASRGYLNDFRGMELADTCVLLLPSGRSAHLEAGWFAGRGKRLIILTRDGEEPELMMLMANAICTSVDEVLTELLA